MSASKIDHKELQRRLKEDELSVYLQEFMQSLKRFYDQWGYQTGIVLIAIAAVIIVYSVWTRKSEQNYQEAQMRYATAQTFMQQKEYEQALAELNSIVNQYSGMEISTMAKVLRGTCYAQQGLYDQAIQDFVSAKASLSGDASIPVRFALVQVYRSTGQVDLALNELEQIEAISKSETVKQQVVFLRASCYEDQNQIDKAIELYESIPVESSWYSVANDRLQWLKAEPVKPIN